MPSRLEKQMEWRIEAHGLPNPVREYRFAAPDRQWRFDFAWPELQLALEVEGGTFANGRHTRGKGFESDCEKYNEAAVRGWFVLRVTSKMVKDGRATMYLRRAIDARP